MCSAAADRLSMHWHFMHALSQLRPLPPPCFLLQDTLHDPNNCGTCGNVCAPNFRCLSGACAELSVACGAQTSYSGNQGNPSYSVVVGSGGNFVRLTFDAFGIPDQVCCECALPHTVVHLACLCPRAQSWGCSAAVLTVASPPFSQTCRQ